MHACGHDTHMATALKTADLFASAKDAWAGTMVFVLQPGEETAAGAKAMVEDGLWDKAPKPEIMLRPARDERACRHRALMDGAAMTTADSFKVTRHGPGLARVHARALDRPDRAGLPRW